MDDHQTNNDQGEITLEQLQENYETAMNNWKRTAADFENYKKRKEAENKELVEFAREVTVAKLLPALDSLEQALRHMPEISGQWTVDSEQSKEFPKKYDNWQKGVNGIVMQLDKTLGELGVKRIEIAAGITKFDPHFHEAVRQVESEIADQIIMEELQSGFILNGKVIRPSQVVISKKQ